MRVAYICADPGIPVFGSKGCSVHTQGVLGALLRRGARVDLFAASAGCAPPPALEKIAVHRLPRLPKSDPADRERAALEANEDLASRLLLHGPYDLVYERYSLWSFAGMEYALHNGMPSVLEVNAPLIDEQAQHRVLVDRAAAQRVAERSFGAAGMMVAVSTEVAAYLGEFPGASEKVHVIWNGVDPHRFPEDMEPTLPQPGTFTIGFVGTLKPWHGLSTLVEAFAGLHERHPHSRLLIVGDGPERARLVEDIRSRGLEAAVHMTGAVAPAQVPGFLASMDVPVAPYPALDHFYFSPLKVYEYMAAGLPVVASRTGQLIEMIENDVTGILVPPGDPVGLTSALDRLRLDAALRSRLGERARDFVLRHHTWDAVVERTLGLAGLPRWATHHVTEI